MSLIHTHISKYGIVHASDSNLTDGNGLHFGEGEKTFPMVFLNAGLTIAGNYLVNGTTMDLWMKNFIRQQSQIDGITLEAFSKNLKIALEAEMTNEELMSGNLIHIAGYVEENGFNHPEFWFVRNVHSIDKATGNYKDINDNFAVNEQFWTGDFNSQEKRELFFHPNKWVHQYYVNGLTPGRIGFNLITQQFGEFFKFFWEKADFKFRPPKSLEEVERMVKINMEVIDLMFYMSDYSARFIGGDVQIHTIQQPDNTTNII